MDYQEFRTRIGNFVVPSQELIDKFVNGLDSIHFIVLLGEIRDGEYKITISRDNMIKFCDALDLLNMRGAVNGKDYFVGGNRFPDKLTIEIHTSTKFISEEDFPNVIIL